MGRSSFTDSERRFVELARVARLATVSPDGTPHAVPICPALDGDRILVATEAGSAKTRNIDSDPRAAVVFDDYVEDWATLRRVLVQGTARIHGSGPVWDLGKRLLEEKFPQYEPIAPIRAHETVMLEVDVRRVSSEGF
jgi:PPOX class probable F420-dependent enzyme